MTTTRHSPDQMHKPAIQAGCWNHDLPSVENTQSPRRNNHDTHLNSDMHLPMGVATRAVQGPAAPAQQGRKDVLDGHARCREHRILGNENHRSQ